MTKPGIYNKRVNGKMRRVRIKANGQWEFLKGTPKPKAKKTAKKTKKKGGYKHKKTTSKKTKNWTVMFRIQFHSTR